MDKKEIKIKVGDTVIRKDGLKGKIIVIDEYDENCSVIQYENGTTSISDLCNPNNMYLIGHTVLGNKVTEEELEERIADCDIQIDEIKSEKKQLRKQLWRLKEEMVEDWKERRQARMNKKENQHTEEDTED